MTHSKRFIYVECLLLLICVSRSHQFVASCIWEDTVTPTAPTISRSFAMSDADACAIFCSKSPGVGNATAISGLCQRCCKGNPNSPTARPTDLLYSILNTVVSALKSKINPNRPLQGKTTANASRSTTPVSSTTEDLFGEDLSASRVPLGGDRARQDTEADYKTGPPAAEDEPYDVIEGRNVQIRLDGATYDSLFHRVHNRRTRRSYPMPRFPDQ